ncbi:MAG: HD domain-containing protein [Nanoarchaeota archaeon]
MIKQDYAKMKIAIRSWMEGRGFHVAIKAMNFAEQHHTGTRKDGQPEFSHQVSQACYARTMERYMLFPEATLAVIFLHDVMEDYNVSYEELVSNFGTQIADAVIKMSKVIKGIKISKETYFENLSTCPIASLAKGFDRVHNLLTMIGGFTPEKQIQYLEETMNDIVPMLKIARRTHVSQEPIYENIKFVMTNQTTLYNSMLNNKNQATISA